MKRLGLLPADRRGVVENRLQFLPAFEAQNQ